MSKKKNNEEKEVKTQAEKQEEKETEATDKAEKNAEENPLEKELKDTKEQLLRVTAEYSNFRKRSEKEKMKALLSLQLKLCRKFLPLLITLKEQLQVSRKITKDLKGCSDDL